MQVYIEKFSEKWIPTNQKSAKCECKIIEFKVTIVTFIFVKVFFDSFISISIRENYFNIKANLNMYVGISL